MKLRVVLLCASLVTAPLPARADEAAGAEAHEIAVTVRRAPRIAMTPAEVLATTRAPSVSASVAARTTEIRLSEGAKTAIIVGAIVVGVLIIVGVVALGGPGKHLK